MLALGARAIKFEGTGQSIPARTDHELRRRRAGAAAQDRTDQAARAHGLRGHAQGRTARGRVPGHALRRGRARRADREDRPSGVRIRHGSQGRAGHTDVSRLPQVDLHVGQPCRLPRHPEREAAEGGRHRQRRRHAHSRRLARRLEPHVRGRRYPAPGRTADRGDLRGDDARHRGDPAGRHHRRHRSGHPDLRRSAST